jgi:hypothetical protein
LAIGGWCPPGRTCDAGTIPDTFPLVETPDDRSANAPQIPRSQRTEWNVRDADATLILRPALAEEDEGTRWTAECAARFGKPLLICDPQDSRALDDALEWLAKYPIASLNVAGPSERTCPGIGPLAKRFVRQLVAGR